MSLGPARSICWLGMSGAEEHQEIRIYLILHITYTLVTFIGLARLLVIISSMLLSSTCTRPAF